MNSQELFEVAATDFSARNGVSFSGEKTQKYMACPEYCHMLIDSSDKIFVCFQRGLVMKLLNMASK
jgi:hypothetical protein